MVWDIQNARTSIVLIALSTTASACTSLRPSPTASTALQISTPPPMLIASPTFTPRPTNSPPPPTATPDLTSLGNPATPIPARWPKPSYSKQGYDIIQRIIHGRPITIAWEKSAAVPEDKRAEISDFYFRSFITWWDVFQGFPYDSYTVVLRKQANNQGETGVGYQDTAGKYAGTLDSELRERIAHELFHAWVGGVICDRDENRFEDGLWFREGITQYYGDRGAGEPAYRTWMQDHFRTYADEIVGTEYDIPLADMPAQGRAAGESPFGYRHYELNVYWKGALVAYLMDERLVKAGLSLDDFLRYLYDTYGLKQKCFVTQQALEALNEVSGQDWTDFFSDYIYGTTKLPLDGKFEYLNHDKHQ